MKKKMLIPIICIMVIFSGVATTYAIYRKSASGTGGLRASTWSVSRSVSQQGDSIDVIPGVSSDTYDLTVTSGSEVDVTYTIIISNLPDDIKVQLDSRGVQTPDPVTHKVTIVGGTINYNDSIKTKNHTLTFSAETGAQTVSNQQINIDVEFKQTI